MQTILDRSIDIATALYPTDLSKEKRRTFHFSILYKNNKVLCIAENIHKTHPRNRFNLRDFDVSMKGVCSEMSLFLKVKSKFDNLDWRRLTLVNVRVDRNGQLRNSAPCPACKNLLRYVGVSSVYHTTDKNGFQKYVA